MDEYERPTACNDNQRIRARARARTLREDDYAELSDLSVAMIGVVFWAFVGLLAGSWLHI